MKSYLDPVRVRQLATLWGMDAKPQDVVIRIPVRSRKRSSDELRTRYHQQIEEAKTVLARSKDGSQENRNARIKIGVAESAIRKLQS